MVRSGTLVFAWPKLTPLATCLHLRNVVSLWEYV